MQGRAHHEMLTLDPSQVRALLDAIADDRLEALYVLAVTTGMRQGELLALRWRDVDLAAGRVRITGTLYWPRGGTPAISEPKTARSRRQLQLSGAAVSALRRHAARNAAERLAHAEWDDPDRTRLHQRVREAGGRQQPSPVLHEPLAESRTPPDSLPRPAAHGSHAPAQRWRPPEDRIGNARARERRIHARRVLAGDRDHAARGRPDNGRDSQRI